MTKWRFSQSDVILKVFINLNGSSHWPDITDNCTVGSGALPARYHHLVAGLWKVSEVAMVWLLVCPFTNREVALYQLTWTCFNILTGSGVVPRWMLHVGPVIAIPLKEVRKLYSQSCRWRNCGAEELNDACKVMRLITEGKCFDSKSRFIPLHSLHCAHVAPCVWLWGRL